MGTKSAIINDLIEKNKGEKFITKDEILMSLEEYALTEKQLLSIYDKFEKVGISVVDVEKKELTSEEIQNLEDEYKENNDIAGLDGLSSYLVYIRRYPLLTLEEEKFYGKIIVTSDDPKEVKAAKDIMIQHNLRLVVCVAKHYKMKLPLLDIIQEGNLGLIKAVDKYDYTKNFRFSTYAVYWIRQAIRKAIDESGLIRMPVHVAENYRKINNAKNTIMMRKGDGAEPTPEEIARETKIPLEKVVSLLSNNYNTLSLDASFKQEMDEDEFCLSEVVSDNTTSIEDEITHLTLSDKIQELLNGLKEKEKIVIILRLGLNGGKGHTLEEVGNYLGLTRERVRQIEKQTLIKLRNNPKAQTLKNFL